MTIRNLTLSPILNLSEFYNKALIEIRKPKADIDSNENNNREISYSLRVELTTNRCIYEHRLDESESWKLAQLCQKFGATGVISAITMSLKVSGRNLPFFIHQIGELLAQIVSECEVCKYRAIASSDEEEIKSDLRMKFLFTGQSPNDSIEEAVLVKEGEYIASVNLLPDDDEGFEKLLEEALKIDRANGRKTAEEQAEEHERVPNETGEPRPIELGLRDTLDLSRAYNIKARLNSSYLREIINSPTSTIFAFGLESDLWEEKEDREVSYIISITKKGDDLIGLMSEGY